jgi:hypothetical protein
MQPKEELDKLYSTFSDRQLLDIVNEKDQYTETAVQVATQEIRRRNLNETHFKDYSDTIVMEAKIAEHVASIELTFFEKLKFFFIWIMPFFIEVGIRMNLAEAGLKTKVKQSRIFSLLGFLTFMLAGFLAVIFNHSDFESISIWILFFVLTYFIEKKFRNKAKKNS